MTEIASRTTQLDSCRIHYLEAGSGDNPTVILLHGMKFQAATWQQVGTLEQLAREGFHAVAVDMPGFGKTPPCSLDNDEVLHHLIHENGGSAALIGPSMGGRTALEFAIAHPSLVERLVLVGAVGVRENEKFLGAISIPTLLVWGRDDRVSPVENLNILADSLPDSRKVILEGAPHPCYLDSPDAWHRELLGFLTSAG
jgi:pimeloyl-ACP methyl ester carboxylesterase